jgi:hypothetical protein
LRDDFSADEGFSLSNILKSKKLILSETDSTEIKVKVSKKERPVTWELCRLEASFLADPVSDWLFFVNMDYEKK